MSLKKKQTFKQRDNVVPYKKAVNHQIFKEDLYFKLVIKYIFLRFERTLNTFRIWVDFI